MGLGAHRPTQGSGQGSSPNLDPEPLTGHLRGQAELGELLLQHRQGHAAPRHLLQLVTPVQELLLFQAFPARQGMVRPSRCRTGPGTLLPAQHGAPFPLLPVAPHLRRWANLRSVASAGTAMGTFVASILPTPRRCQARQGLCLGAGARNCIPEAAGLPGGRLLGAGGSPRPQHSRS